ncbi:uncharacterized protein LOC134281325 [Saccostrea cucullata]|uniref:uncharacterized protein LOC134281325 n=1 Tax=Saccostrea cuccullata TaxID=36930 RepID=UPI002ED606D1
MALSKTLSAVFPCFFLFLPLIHECVGQTKEYKELTETVRSLQDDMKNLKYVVLELKKQNDAYAEKIQSLESTVSQCSRECLDLDNIGHTKNNLNFKDIFQTIENEEKSQRKILSQKRFTKNEKIINTVKRNGGLSRQTRLLIQGNVPMKPAFYAMLQSDLIVPPGQLVKFQRVITNVGDFYSPHTGIFTAYHSGTFGFSISYTVPRHSCGYLRIMKNSDELITVGEDETTQYEVISATIVVQLNEHDTVYVKTSAIKPSTSLISNAAAQSIFVGWEI